MTASASVQFLRTSGLVALAMVGLFAVDTFLARTEQRESLVEGARLFDLGQRLLAQGQAGAAVDRFKDALDLERGNRGYEKALGRAELAAGETADAEATLSDVLLNDSTDGEANFIMGQVLLKEGKTREAISFYHRAVYGQWKEDAEGNRLKVRFELIDLLAGQDSREELLAELLAVQDRMPGDAATRLRMGKLFLAAGSPDRAADVFREVVKDQGRDEAAADAYAGLGEAAFAKGDYRSAESAFQAAERLKPEDPNLGRRLDLAARALAMDPAVRGIGAGERLRRSRELVRMAVDAASCVDANSFPGGQDPVVQELMGAAGKALAERVGVTGDEAAREKAIEAGVEANVELAGRLWQARKAGCRPAPDSDEALGVVLGKTAVN